jgi:hypothetical protein
MTFSMGAPLPNLNFSGVDGSRSLQSFAVPCDSNANLLVLRVVAGWCGTCRWHSAHTSSLVPADLTSRVQMVDLLLANDNNQLASGGDLNTYQSHGDGQTPVLADPAFTLAPLFTSSWTHEV